MDARMRFISLLLLFLFSAAFCQESRNDQDDDDDSNPLDASGGRFGRRGVLTLEDRIGAVFTKVAYKNASLSTQNRGRLSMGTLISTMLSRPAPPDNPTPKTIVPKTTTTTTTTRRTTTTPALPPPTTTRPTVRLPPSYHDRNNSVRLNTPLKIPQRSHPYYKPPGNNSRIKVEQHRNLDLWKILTNPNSERSDNDQNEWKNNGSPGVRINTGRQDEVQENNWTPSPRNPSYDSNSNKPEKVLFWDEVPSETPEVKREKVNVLLEEANSDSIVDRRPNTRQEVNSIAKPTSVYTRDQVQIIETVPFPEPGPIWEQAKKEWGVAWEIHVYPMAVLFMLLALWCLFNMVRISSNAYLLSKGYFISLNCLMVIIGTLRSITMFHDAYNLRHNYPPVLGYLLFNIVFPCITSSFAIIFLFMLHITRVKLVSSKIQNGSVLIIITAIHFVVSFCTDIIVGSVFSARVLLLICQSLFLLWALLLASSYFYIFNTLYNSALHTQNEMMRETFTRLHIGGQTLPKKLPRATLALSVRITLVTAVLILLFIGTQLYGMFGVYGIMCDESPLPWPWWCYQFTMRALEIVMCYLMAFVASQPMRRYEIDMRKSKQHPDDSKCSVFSLMNCGKFWNCSGTRSWSCGNSATTSRPSEVTDDIYPTICSANQAVRNYELHNGMSIYEDLYPMNNSMNGPTHNGTLPSLHSHGRRSLKKSSTLCSSNSATHSCCLHPSQPVIVTDRPNSLLLADGRILTFKNADEASQLLDQMQKNNYGQYKNNPSHQEEVLTAFLGPEGVQNILSPVPSLDNSERLNTQSLRLGKVPPYKNRLQRSIYEQPRKPLNSYASIDTTDLSSTDGRGSSTQDMRRVYASTCSSESASQSFDLQLYNTIDCSSRSPSTCSPPDYSKFSLVSPYNKCETNQNNSDLVQYIQCMSPSGVPFRVPVHGRTDLSQIDHPPGTKIISRDHLSHLTNSDIDVNFLRVASVSALRMPDRADADDNHLHRTTGMHLDLQDNAQSNSTGITPDSAIVADISDTRSLNDLVESKVKRGLIDKLKSSNFSLNMFHGYSPLNCDDNGSIRRYDSSYSLQSGSTDGRFLSGHYTPGSDWGGQGRDCEYGESDVRIDPRLLRDTIDIARAYEQSSVF